MAQLVQLLLFYFGSITPLLSYTLVQSLQRFTRNGPVEKFYPLDLQFGLYKQKLNMMYTKMILKRKDISYLQKIRIYFPDMFNCSIERSKTNIRTYQTYHLA